MFLHGRLLEVVVVVEGSAHDNGSVDATVGIVGRVARSLGTEEEGHSILANMEESQNVPPDLEGQIVEEARPISDLVGTLSTLGSCGSGAPGGFAFRSVGCG